MTPRKRQTRREAGTQSHGPLPLKRGSRAAERSLMEPSEYRSTLPLELLASSLAMRLTLDELDWLWRELAQRTEAQKRREEVLREQREPLVRATYRNA